MNTPANTVLADETETFNADVYRRLDVDAGGFTVEVEAPDGFAIQCAPWSPQRRVGTLLGVEDYLYTVSQRVSGQRRVGPFGAANRRATVHELHVARRAVTALLVALDAKRVAEGCYRMILGGEVTPQIHPREWRIVPSFLFFSQAIQAIAEGRLAAEDVQSYGPETEVVRILRETGALVAFGTSATGGERGDAFLCRKPNGDLVELHGVAQAHEFVESLG